MIQKDLAQYSLCMEELPYLGGLKCALSHPGCCSRGGRKRKHAWELNREFKLGNLLDSKHEGFEKLGQEASDDEITAREA